MDARFTTTDQNTDDTDGNNGGTKSTKSTITEDLLASMVSAEVEKRLKEKRDPLRPKDAREICAEHEAKKAFVLRAAETTLSAGYADIHLAGKVLGISGEEALKRAAPIVTGDIASDARREGFRAGKKEMLPAMAIGALGVGLVSWIAGRVGGVEAGKKARPVSSVAAEAAIEWLVGKL